MNQGHEGGHWEHWSLYLVLYSGWPCESTALRGSLSTSYNVHLYRLALRINGMEGVIENIVSKIDTVLIKLESMERSKTKRKANASRILDVFTVASPDG